MIKKILFVFALLITVKASATPANWIRDVTGLGLPPELANFMTQNPTVYTNGTWIVEANATPGGADLKLLRADTSNNTHVNALTGKSLALDINLLTRWNVDSSGNFNQNATNGGDLVFNKTAANINATASTTFNLLGATGGTFLKDSSGNVDYAYGSGAIAVPTLVATPVAGTNVFTAGINIVPTVAANAAAFLGPATPVPGQIFDINNSGPNSVRVKAAGGATLNGATAGGYITLATLATVHCFTASTTNQVCEQPVIPTPAGP